MDLLAEKIAYHTLALDTHGNYQKLEKIFSAHASWNVGLRALGTQRNPQKEWELLHDQKVNLILRSEFPALLSEMPWQPFALYYTGAPLGIEKKVAIVGTRKASPAGLETAKLFGRDLGRAGLTIVSGLALGTDAAAHEGALNGGTKTIAVLANGLDTVYPRQNERLAQTILARGGTLVSEYPPGTPSLPHFFIERNRIVSGLSIGVVIIEAPQKSGTIATARFAIEQNREVFVLPGGVKNPNYEGSNALLKQGATLVTEPQDILTHLAIEPGLISSPKTDKLAKNEQLVLNVLTSLGTPTAPDTIGEQTQLDQRTVNESLAVLLIEGIIKEAHGKYFIV